MCPPSPWSSMPWQERLDPVDDAAEQHTQAPVPVVVARQRDRPEDAHAGVVAEHVHVAEDALRLVGRAREALAVGDIELDRVHVLPPPALGQALQSGLEVVGTEVGDHDVHPRCDERLAHTEPDPARTAGDERGLAGDLFHAA